MPKNHCVNSSSPIIQALVKETGLPAAVAEARIALWQEREGLDKLPTAAQILGEIPPTFDKAAWEAEHARQTEIWGKLAAEEAETVKNVSADNTVNEYLRPGEGNRKVSTRTSDVVARETGSTFSDQETTPKGEFMAGFGTLIHADIEALIKRFIDADGFLKTDEAGALAPSPAGTPHTNKAYYMLLEGYVRDLMKEYNNNPKTRGVRIRLETVVYQPAAGKAPDQAGTIDFVAILPDGTTEILDWKSYNLNKKKFGDIPWYKTRALRIQLREYKRMLKARYGVEAFGRTRGIPMQLSIAYNEKTKEWRPTELEVGKNNARAETRDYLLPIATRDESTGDPAIDARIELMNALYDVLYKQDIPPAERARKDAELNQLIYATRHLQVKGDIAPTLDLIELMNNDTQEFINNYNSTLRDTDPSALSLAEVEAYSRRIKNMVDKYLPFEKLHIDLAELTQAHPELNARMLEVTGEMERRENALQNVLFDFVDKYLGQRNKENFLLKAELEQRGIKTWTASQSAGHTSAISVFYRLFADQHSQAVIAENREADKLAKLAKKFSAEAKSHGLPVSRLFAKLKKKGEDGKLLHRRLDQYQKEFYTGLTEAVKNQDLAWIKEHTDWKSYQIWAEVEQAKEAAHAREFVYSPDPVVNKERLLQKLAQIDTKYNTTNDKSPGWFQYKQLRDFPLEKWLSAEYKELQKFPAAFELYTYIQDRVDRATETGFYTSYGGRSFLPYLAKRPKIDMALGAAVRSTEQGEVYINELTGQRQYKFPATTLNAIENPDEDLFVAMEAFNTQLIDYEYRGQIQAQLTLLQYAEHHKKEGSVISGRFGNPQRKKGGGVQLNPSNEVNANLLDEFVAINYHAQRDVEGQKDAVLYTFGEGIDNLSKAVNKGLGKQVFPENLSGKSITALGLWQGLSNYYQMKVLALNVAIPISNLVGGHFQAFINSGRFFTQGEAAAAEMGLTYHVMAQTEGGKKELAILHDLVPFAENLSDDRRKKVSVSKLAHYTLSDGIFAMYRATDKPVQHMLAKAMLDNAVVIDGALVNARVYVRKQHEDRYQHGNIKATERQMEAEIAALKKEKGLFALTTVKDDQLVYPVSDLELARYRELTIQVIKKATGQMTADQRNKINASILGRSVMTFKNWIPQLVSNRFRPLGYSPATDSIEWGRTVMMFAVLKGAFQEKANLFRAITSASPRGIAYMRTLLAEKKRAYEEETGRRWEFSEAEFMDMMRQGIGSALRDVAYTASVLAMFLALRGMIPEGDDDDKETRGYWAFASRQMHKISQELTFFYNPLDIQQMANGSIIPSLGIVTDAVKLVTNLGKELFGDADKAHPLKYAMKMVPLANQANTLMGYVSADYAKEMGVKVSSEVVQIR